ncbi:MAG: hypothetical protein IKA76_09640 [Clostridia bacterium]|nr:hypothetical protein [Clostridia bacterium]
MNHEISFPTLLKTFKKCWWKVLIVALCAAILMLVFTICFIPKKYSSSMEVYIINTNTSYDYTTSSLLSANDYLINDYIAIMKGDRMLKRVCAELKAEASTYTDKSGAPFLNEQQLEAIQRLEPPHIRSMLDSAADDDSSIFGLSVSHTDPKLAYVIARKIAEISPEEVTDVAKSKINERASMAEDIYNAMDFFNDGKHNENVEIAEEDILKYLESYNIGLSRQDCISIIIEPKLATSHDSPNAPVLSILAGFAAAIIAYVIFLLLSLSKSVIVTEEDVKRTLKYPMIGVIPHWSISGNKSTKN